MTPGEDSRGMVGSGRAQPAGCLRPGHLLLGVTGSDQHQAVEKERHSQRDDQGRHAEPNGDQPVEQADASTQDQGDEDGRANGHARVPKPVDEPWRRQVHLAGGEVDLGQYQHEDFAGADHDERRHVLHGDDDVVDREEGRGA